MDTKLAFVFPGQGSQSVGMLSALAKEFPPVREIYDTASDVLGYDLWKLVEHGPEDELNQTEKTQPALLCAGFAVWNVWQANNGAMPAVFAGHSLGEYTALVCAKAIDFKSAVQLVADRGRFMQNAAPEGLGAMAAIIGLDDGRVEEICRQLSSKGLVTPANYNAIGQVVIAGEKALVEEAILLANDAGARLAKILQVSVPSHSPLMKPAALQLEKRLAENSFISPEIDIINNVDVAVYSKPDEIKDGLVRQLYNPIRWVDTLLKMSDLGIERIVECGPGRVLTGLVRRIDGRIKALPVSDPENLQKALLQLKMNNEQ